MASLHLRPCFYDTHTHTVTQSRRGSGQTPDWWRDGWSHTCVSPRVLLEVARGFEGLAAAQLLAAVWLLASVRAWVALQSVTCQNQQTWCHTQSCSLIIIIKKIPCCKTSRQQNNERVQSGHKNKSHEQGVNDWTGNINRTEMGGRLISFISKPIFTVNRFDFIAGSMSWAGTCSKLFPAGRKLTDVRFISSVRALMNLQDKTVEVKICIEGHVWQVQILVLRKLWKRLRSPWDGGQWCKASHSPRTRSGKTSRRRWSVSPACCPDPAAQSETSKTPVYKSEQSTFRRMLLSILTRMWTPLSGSTLL